MVPGWGVDYSLLPFQGFGKQKLNVSSLGPVLNPSWKKSNDPSRPLLINFNASVASTRNNPGWSFSVGNKMPEAPCGLNGVAVIQDVTWAMMGVFGGTMIILHSTAGDDDVLIKCKVFILFTQNSVNHPAIAQHPGIILV